MSEAAHRIGVGEATTLVFGGVTALAAETVALADAYGRVLAESVCAPRDLPPWRNASMDGYAVRAADVRGASRNAAVTLRVVEVIAAGTLPSRTIGTGDAARIMTGAPLPEGADGVVRVEDTDRGVDNVRIVDARDAGANVRPRGEDIATGAVAAAAGQQVGAALMGVLAAIGAQSVAVHRRPRVAILSAGDELLPLDRHERAVAEQRVVDINSVTLAALARDAGAEVELLGLAPDDPAAIRTLIEGAREHDVLITSGGVSVGDHDHTRDVLRSLGADILIHGVRIRPGAPFVFGNLGTRRWMGLPGNPVSAMVTFELFARPLIRRLAGHQRVVRATVAVRTRDAIRTAAPLTHYLRVVVAPAAGGALEAILTGPQGSGLITSMARANALLIVPETMREVAAGTTLHAMLLDDTTLWADGPVA